MILFPNAKINIGLNIVRKRSDGFHNIETIFYPIGLSDILEINQAESMRFQNTGIPVENRNPENNLCYKAYQVLKADFNLNPVSIHLHKIIPFGAGVGGGSADASFTLKMLRTLNNLNLNDQQLFKYAEKIGSDCAFFLLNKPAFATEKGNSLTSICLDLKGYFLVLIHPRIHISTAKAYSNITPEKPRKSLQDLIKTPIENWKETVVNDFEKTVFAIEPELKNIKEELYNQGAVYASMSGSGSAIYGIFKNRVDLKKHFSPYFIWTQWL